MKKSKREKTRTGEQQGDSVAYSKIRRAVIRLVLWLFRIRIHYAEREPDGENYLLCCNHISAMDPVILGVALGKRQTHFMAKKELFRVPLVAAFLRSINAFPVDRTGDISAIKTTISLIKNGDCVGVFPQGTRCPGRTPRECLEEVKGGVGLLCDKTHVTVLPACLRVKGNRLRLFGGGDLIIGHPIPYEQLAAGLCDGEQALSHQQTCARLSRRVFESICDLYEGSLPNETK